ncbi:MAG: hypothetical protein COU08_02710 [Candidatus Harrisonbacteria bacterium CG10_big_fil_rev_8_21_14_0_10_42_17]|uniref:Uncharacterized protein n=1 Tax=Candidatus Harrisonbacteria bacterium CG10_big_fil_rev_8_21_14_0_10_42_17 TaxID=1974584 RepID=A0A2M6WHZ1_9BACT|nr:MAG: hypothetical protein COU08_02710 [Candidatus Harrisonbacteria bacterium CG10_big_fil_rev_8_21_14_0_10_42_17]
MDVDLVVRSVNELGFPEGALYDTIIARARERGLDLCPAEVDPQLKLQYTDQPMDEWLHIAMEPITDMIGNLRIFFVGHDEDGRWLSTDRCSPDIVWCSFNRFLFVRLHKVA